MGKIFNALEKYKIERKTATVSGKMVLADWDLLLTYDRAGGKLDLNRREVKEQAEGVKRLRTYGFIQADGTLTPAGKAKCDEMDNQQSEIVARVTANRAKQTKPLAAVSARETDAVAAEAAPDMLADIMLPAELVMPDDEPEVAAAADPAPPEAIAAEVVTPETKPAVKRSKPVPSIEPLKGEDWAVLLQYDRANGILDLNAPGLIDDTRTIQRLLDHKLITYGGKLTPAALQTCKKLENGNRRAVPADDKKQASLKSVKKDSHPQVAPEKPAVAKAKPVVKERPAVKVLPKATGSKNIDKNLISFLRPKSFESEQFKILRTNLMYPVNGEAPKSIMVTSALPDEGKSFVAANLAVSIAGQINRNVLLMDCDLRRPAVHSYFGYPEVPGLSDYLSNGTPLPSLLLRTRVEALTILPAGKPPHNPSELLSSERMIDLIAEVTERYSNRIIILDTPPPKLTAEAGALARQVDGVLLVVKYGSTPRNTVAELIDKMGREKIIGAIINNFDVHSPAYYSKYYGK